MNNKLLYVLISTVILLIGVNLFMLFGHQQRELKRPPQHHNPEKHIGEILKFDENQKEQLNKEFKLHSDLVEKEFKKIKKIKKSIYQNIIAQGSSTEIDSVNSEIAIHITNIETLFYQHLKRIRSICREDQIELFNEWMQEMENGENRGPRNNIGPPPKHPH